jgi:hypothetical protein
LRMVFSQKIPGYHVHLVIRQERNRHFNSSG